MTVQEINKAIESLPNNKGQISDGYHTFDELYEHRITLFCVLSRFVHRCWKSKLHSDGTMYEGWFIAGINTEQGKQISYHLPLRLWDYFEGNELETAPIWDGHNSQDVLDRLLQIKI